MCLSVLRYMCISVDVYERKCLLVEALDTCTFTETKHDTLHDCVLSVRIYSLHKLHTTEQITL